MVNCADFIASLAQILNKTLNLLVRKKSGILRPFLSGHNYYFHLKVQLILINNKKNRDTFMVQQFDDPY
jgi:hypothetical protein